MERYLKIATIGLFALASLASKAGTVGRWELSSLRSAVFPEINETITKQIKNYVSKHCRELTPGEDVVTLISQEVTHTDYYPFGNQYYPLDYSDLVLVRSNGVESYKIEMKAEWDYDLPMPMITVFAPDSANCKYTPPTIQ